MATGVVQTHTYSSAAAYTITLRVTDDGGLTGTTTRSVTAASNTPGQPTDLKITATMNSATLTWTAPSYTGGKSIVGYKIYRGTSSDQMTLLASVDNVLTYSDNTVESGKTYYYKVAAINPAEGQTSDTADVLIPHTSRTPYVPISTGTATFFISLLALLVIIATGIFLRTRKKHSNPNPVVSPFRRTKLEILR